MLGKPADEWAAGPRCIRIRMALAGQVALSWRRVFGLEVLGPRWRPLSSDCSLDRSGPSADRPSLFCPLRLTTALQLLFLTPAPTTSALFWRLVASLAMFPMAPVSSVLPAWCNFLRLLPLVTSVSLPPLHILRRFFSPMTSVFPILHRFLPWFLPMTSVSLALHRFLR